MTKEKRLFLITAVVLTVLYIATAVTAIGKVFVPSSYWSIQTESQDKENSLASASVLIDLELAKKVIDEDGNENTKTVAVKEIYAFIGAVRSWETDGDNQYVTLNFNFKTTSDNDVGLVRKEVSKKIPVVNATGGYRWVKVFDATEKGNLEIRNYSRVLVYSPDSIDLHEVAFIDSDGELMKVSVAKSTATEEQKTYTAVVIDEQELFTTKNSKKCTLTDDELKSLAAVDAIKGANAQVGVAPFDTMLDAIAVAVFGKNAFAVRFFDWLAGLGILLLLYAFVFKLFNKAKFAVCAVCFALFFGAVFTASTFSFGLSGAFFALLSLYLASTYFIRNYYFEDQKGAIKNLILIGITYGVAISANMAYSLILVGHLALLIMAGRRGYKQYKKDENQAEGLGKEEVFLAYRKKKVLASVYSIISLLFVPTVIFMICYLFVFKAYKNYYGLGFMASAFAHFKASLTPAYQFNPFALLVGLGGKVGDYYSVLNLFVGILSLISFVFVSVAVLFRNKIAAFKNITKVENKYKIITACFLSSLLPVIFGLTSSPWGFALPSVFFVTYIVFAKHILSKIASKKITKTILNVCIVISFVIFAMAFVSHLGLNINETASKILYLWQVN